MSAPSVTAAATAVYQYLRDGHYHHMVPIKASLVKAMLVHSTVPMMGYCAYDHRYCEGFHSWPNTFQGHGRVVLKNVLHFSNTQGWDLFLDIATLLDSTSEIQYDIDLLSLAAFKVTLVWTDPASSSISNTVLINDIDITVVIVPTGKVVYANGKNSKDHLNNVEVISLSKNDLSNYFSNESSHQIRVVVGVTGLSCSQEYSLVITGDFDATSLSPHFTTAAPQPPVEPSESPRDSSSFSFVDIFMVIIIFVVFMVVLLLFMSSYVKKARKRQLKTLKKVPSEKKSSSTGKNLRSPQLPTRPPVGKAVSLASSLSSKNVHQNTTNNNVPLKPMMPPPTKPRMVPSSNKPLPPPSSKPTIPLSKHTEMHSPSSKPTIPPSNHPAMHSPSSKPTILPPPSLQQVIQERSHSSPPPLPEKSKQHSYRAVVLAPTKGYKPQPALPSKPNTVSPLPPPGLKKEDHKPHSGHSHMVSAHHHQDKPLPKLPAKSEMNDIGLIPQNGVK